MPHNPPVMNARTASAPATSVVAANQMSLAASRPAHRTTARARPRARGRRRCSGGGRARAVRRSRRSDSRLCDEASARDERFETSAPVPLAPVGDEPDDGSSRADDDHRDPERDVQAHHRAHLRHSPATIGGRRRPVVAMCRDGRGRGSGPDVHAGERLRPRRLARVVARPARRPPLLSQDNSSIPGRLARKLLSKRHWTAARCWPRMARWRDSGSLEPRAGRYSRSSW
jgi:hypothetical protein